MASHMLINNHIAAGAWCITGQLAGNVYMCVCAEWIQYLSVTLHGILRNSTAKKVPYSGKVWWGKSLANWASRSFGEEKFGECR